MTLEKDYLHILVVSIYKYMCVCKHFPFKQETKISSDEYKYSAEQSLKPHDVTEYQDGITYTCSCCDK